ncbi:unnamed protein product [Pleuronectes platessa]|uniref:Uncharacterized protein n=1 Tax=Pleuronectes platessa TaxID=8262 RepID=A0A9N7YFP8_PLEPL|nr:unnamed protein product [Pleuronectes platessa]
MEVARAPSMGPAQGFLYPGSIPCFSSSSSILSAFTPAIALPHPFNPSSSGSAAIKAAHFNGAHYRSSILDKAEEGRSGSIDTIQRGKDNDSHRSSSGILGVAEKLKGRKIYTNEDFLEAVQLRRKELLPVEEVM